MTYRTREALPTILPAERLYRSRPISDGLLALLALRETQAHMTLFAIRVPPIYGESNAILTTAKIAVSGERLSA